MESIGLGLKKVNLYETLADRLEETIVNDTNMIGQKLPSENELAKNLGVSRNIVREALKLLKERGLIASRTGDGSYVSRPDPQILTSVIGRMLAMHDIDADDVYEMRIMLECHACLLAVQHATEAELDHLSSINSEMEAKQSDLATRVSLDLDFHAQIAEMSRNALLSIFARSMNHLCKAVIEWALQSKGGSQDGVEYHYRIIAALRSRNAEQAAKIMRDHLNESMRRYKCVKLLGKCQQDEAPTVNSAVSASSDSSK